MEKIFLWQTEKQKTRVTSSVFEIEIVDPFMILWKQIQSVLWKQTKNSIESTETPLTAGWEVSRKEIPFRQDK